jgi:hypothetical protein
VLLTYLDSYFVIKKLKEDYFLFNLHILLMFHLKIILGLEKKKYQLRAFIVLRAFIQYCTTRKCGLFGHVNI